MMDHRDQEVRTAISRAIHDLEARTAIGRAVVAAVEVCSAIGWAVYDMWISTSLPKSEGVDSVVVRDRSLGGGGASRRRRG